MHNRFLAWPRAAKRALVMALDVALAMIAVWGAFYLRLDVVNSFEGSQLWLYLLAPALAIPIFIKFGLYRAIFRYTGQAALTATANAVGIYTVALFGFLLLYPLSGVPRSIGLLQPIIFLLLVGTSRAFARFWLAGVSKASGFFMPRLLIFGAGTAGAQTAAALEVTRQFTLVGFVDDDPKKIGHSINGVQVFAAHNIAELVEQENISDILLALPSASRERRNKIIESLENLPVHVRSLPSMSDLTSGKVTVQDFRELDIEDLLGREPVSPNMELLARDLTNQVVLVSGAGGSIGSELTRQIVFQRPKRLVLLDHSEFALYSIHQELQQLCQAENLQVELIPLLASVLHVQRLHNIFAQYRPDTVYHAAAYKHVPMVEANPGEGVLNNVIGTMHVAQTAVHYGVHRFVLISTDKAVRPTNIMGASKRMAELVLQALAQIHTNTAFSIVRFGNVLGSSGSVVPLFRKQLAQGGPLTVTHAEVTRYFMTIPEAAQLVLQAGAMGQGADVFVLDMGKPVKIIDLAHRMVHLSGLKVRDAQHPHGDIAISVIGLRPGEKLYEELLIGDNPEPTAHPRIMKAREPWVTWAQLETELERLTQAAQNNDASAIKAIFLQYVQGYQPTASHE